MSGKPTLEYKVISDILELTRLIENNDLYLPKGRMLNRLRISNLGCPGESFGILAIRGGEVIAVAAMAGIDDQCGDGMLFVKKSSRGAGVAEALVSKLLAHTPKTIRFYPWDIKSICFFRRLFNQGILAGKNFLPYEANLIGQPYDVSALPVQTELSA